MSAIKKYRKKPVTIEAAQWDGTAAGATPLIDWMLAEGGNASYHDPDEALSFPQGRINVQTLEGGMAALPGDFIIKGVQGEFYPCKPDIFDATYSPVDDA
jgi:hypothetical protein